MNWNEAAKACCAHLSMAVRRGRTVKQLVTDPTSLLTWLTEALALVPRLLKRPVTIAQRLPELVVYLVACVCPSCVGEIRIADERLG